MSSMKAREARTQGRVWGVVTGEDRKVVRGASHRV